VARRRYAAPPPLTIDPNKRYTARIKTNQGDIVVALNAQDAPVTVNNFVFLAREGFYDGVIFHRVIPGFVIQGGDPAGTGTGGPGYSFRDEPVRSKYEAGSIAMANSGPNTNGSQFFICDGQGCASLPPNYNHFGKVSEGLEVVTRIASVPKTRGSDGQQSKPITPVVIATVEITEE
jgi:cyclophilin family peptidyl-prolyl cis-trans isomerase